MAAIGAITYPVDMLLYGEMATMFTDRIDTPEATSSETYLLPMFGGGTIL